MGLEGMETSMRLVTVVSGWMVLLATAAMAAPGDTFLVTGDVVNVRTGPGSNYRIRVQIRRGDAAVELAREGEWVEVELPGQGETGWIHDSLLTAGPGPAPTEAPAEPAATEAAPPAAPAESEAAPPAPPAATEAAPPAAPAPTAAEAPATALPQEAETAPAVTAEPQASDASPAAPEAATATTPAVDAPSGPIAEFGDSVSVLNQRAVAVAGVDLFVGVEPADDATVRVMVTEAWATVPEAGQQSYMNTLVGRWHDATGGGGPVRVQVIAPDGSVAREAAGP